MLNLPQTIRPPFHCFPTSLPRRIERKVLEMAPLVIRRSRLPDQYSSLITVIHGTFADWSHQPPPQLTLPRREMNTCWYLAACLDIVLGLSVAQTTCLDIGTETNQRVLDHTLVTKNEPSLLLPHHGPPVRQLTLSTAMQIYGH